MNEIEKLRGEYEAAIRADERAVVLKAITDRFQNPVKLVDSLEPRTDAKLDEFLKADKSPRVPLAKVKETLTPQGKALRDAAEKRYRKAIGKTLMTGQWFYTDLMAWLENNPGSSAQEIRAQFPDVNMVKFRKEMKGQFKMKGEKRAARYWVKGAK